MNDSNNGPKHAAAGPADLAHDDAMVRSEEHVVVRTERVPVRRARLQRFVVTEQRTVTVDVQHEEVRLVYEDIESGSAEGVAAASADDPMPTVVLREEQIEISRRIVPTERVTLVKERSTTEVDVPVRLRSEQITLEREGRNASD